MIKVGVTGGIGSGKTTFCKVWEELGAYVVYADDFAKHLMVTDQQIISQIKDAFGDLSYEEDGRLNRSFLAEEAFKKGRVKELNAIVHPVLWKRMDELAQEKEREGVRIFVKEAAILLQHGRPKDLNYVVLLDAPKSARIERVSERDNTAEDLVTDRMNKQQSFDDVVHLADFRVFNDESEEALMKKATSLFKTIQSQK